ncbi:uncharacterized protein LOC129945949 [Eupeodes corollae]|uniref:uncharacterized protein LOC129945949 n=1 Tax=Eupeodes corollae TaxID=290404 RepID=UPI002492E08E|nr:uncharacterized protein LOC129945949 [Eupeodes corollae]
MSLRLSLSSSGIKGVQFAFVQVLIFHSALCEIEYNNVNPDGSFSFRHSNDDIGSYYHSAAGNPDNKIRGRYGSRNPSNGRVEETVYTAGPRGFRANGPQIHRKMDLSQIPRGPKGNADDPLADPYDDPTYSFSFKTSDYNRNEDSDSSGRIRGLYSYFDDIGERHTVRYAAGAGTGFKVLNSVPDSQTSVAYSAPLWKGPPGARGKIAVERGSNGMYKFIAAAPDHRRSEVSGPDGIVRGSYSYLDDKGVQRTVEYEAGAGIGYRIVKNSIGPGTHNNAIVPYLRASDDFPKEFLQTSSSDSLKSKNKDTAASYSDSEEAIETSKGSRTSSNSNANGKSKNRGSMMGSGSKISGKTTRPNDGNEEDPSEYDGNSSSKSSNKLASDQNSKGLKSKGGRFDSNFENDLSSLPPLITSNRRILEIGREKDWNSHNRDSTLIKNVGKWYIGLPPGQSVRAHVQNIDILPIGGRTLSPSEALRRDELSELAEI